MEKCGEASRQKILRGKCFVFQRLLKLKWIFTGQYRQRFVKSIKDFEYCYRFKTIHNYLGSFKSMIPNLEGWGLEKFINLLLFLQTVRMSNAVFNQYHSSAPVPAGCSVGHLSTASISPEEERQNNINCTKKSYRKKPGCCEIKWLSGTWLTEEHIIKNWAAEQGELHVWSCCLTTLLKSTSHQCSSDHWNTTWSYKLADFIFDRPKLLYFKLRWPVAFDLVGKQHCPYSTALSVELCWSPPRPLEVSTCTEPSTGTPTTTLRLHHWAEKSNGSIFIPWINVHKLIVVSRPDFSFLWTKLRVKHDDFHLTEVTVPLNVSR